MELERYNRDVTKEKENQSKVEMVIKGMRYLKLKVGSNVIMIGTKVVSQGIRLKSTEVIWMFNYCYNQIYPDYALEDTADFLQSCAKFFKNAHGVKVKHAYAHLFVQLMLPIAAVSVEV